LRPPGIPDPIAFLPEGGQTVHDVLPFITGEQFFRAPLILRQFGNRD
jgi:hypothetical protein